MGMNTRGASGSGKTFLGVYSNELVLEYTKEEDLVRRLESLGYDVNEIKERKKTKGKNEGQAVYYFVIDDIDGMITDIKINELDWGDFVEVTLTDVDEKFVISLGDVFGRAAKDFIRRVGNLNLNEEVNFGLWSMITDDDKRRSGVKMYQGPKKTKVEYFLTYDDMPAPIEKKKGRKTEWDYSEQETYIYDYLVKYLEDNIKSSETKEQDLSHAISSTTNPQAVVKEKQEKPARKVRGKRQPPEIIAEKSDGLPF